MDSYWCPHCSVNFICAGIPRCSSCGRTQQWNQSASDSSPFVASSRKLLNDEKPPKRNESVHVLDYSKSKIKVNVAANISNIKENEIGKHRSKCSDPLASTSESVGPADGNLAIPGPSGHQNHLNTTILSTKQTESLMLPELQCVETNELQTNTRQINKRTIVEQEKSHILNRREQRNQIGTNRSKYSDSVASTRERDGLPYGNLATPGPSSYPMFGAAWPNMALAPLITIQPIRPGPPGYHMLGAAWPNLALAPLIRPGLSGCQKHLNTMFASNEEMQSMPQSELQSVEHNEQDNRVLYICCVCRYEDTGFTLQEHIQHHYPESQRCWICREIVSKFNEHGRKHTCKACGIKFLCRTLLATHSLKHQEKSICILCGNAMSEHKKYPKDQKPYQCCDCAFRFQNKHHLQRHHCSSSHTNLKPFKCHVCDIRTADLASLKKHEGMHRTCEICRANEVSLQTY